MIWAMKDVEIAEGAEVFDRFEKLFFEAAAPKGMLLTAHPEKSSYYMCLRDNVLLAAFPGFSEVPQAELPETAILLIGAQSDFEQFFRFPKPY